MPAYARDLMREVLARPADARAPGPALADWDLGDTNGTVALRMPDHEIALELLGEVGPMAVTSANLTGQPAAATVAEAPASSASAVAVYLDGGPSEGARRRPSSTAPRRRR